MRIIGLSAIAIFITGLMLSSLHFWGLSQQPKSFDHAWFHRPMPWRVLFVDLASDPRANKDDILWINVLSSESHHLYSAPKNFEVSTKRWSDSEIQGLGFVDLQTLLDQHQGRDFILNVLSNTDGIDLQISDLIGTRGLNHVLIQSDFDVIMKSIKKLQPLWLFGSSQAERVRFRSFESLWILPSASFEGDVYVGPLKQKKVELLSEGVAQEMKRRHQSLIVGPLANKSEYEQAIRLGADGVFIDQAELLGLISSL